METGNSGVWTLSNILAATAVFCNLLPAAARVMVKVLETGNNGEMSQHSYTIEEKSCRQRNGSGTSRGFINYFVPEPEAATSVLRNSFSLSESE